MPPKRKKHVNRAYSGTKEVLFKEDECHWYALALKALGDRRFRLLCDDGVERIGKLRGNMRRRQFVSAGTLVLASVRMASDPKVDIFHTYPDAHVKMLTRYGELRDLHEHHVRWQRENEIGGPGVSTVPDDEEVHNEDLVVFEEDDDDVNDIIDTI
jgi:translation initiation factor 1A